MLVSTSTNLRGRRAGRSTSNVVEPMMVRAARLVWVLPQTAWSFSSMRGHACGSLNERADALARLASRYRRGDRDLNDDEYRRRAAGIA